MLIVALVNGLPKRMKDFIKKSSKENITVQSLESKLVEFDMEKVSNIVDVNIAKPRKKFKKQRNRIRCFKCGEVGHFKKDCFKKRFAQSAKLVEVLAVTTITGINDSWLVDSGAGSHMVNNIDLLNNVRGKDDCWIRTANGETVKVQSIGDVSLSGENGNILELTGCLFVPDLAYNLISVSQLVKDGYSVEFGTTSCEIMSKGNRIINADLKNNIYVVNVAISDAKLIHQKYGHPGRKASIRMGISPLQEICEACIYGEHRASPFNRRGRIECVKSTRQLQLVHMDLIGPIEELSFGGAKYVLSLIDDFSRYSYVYFLKSKSDVFNHFKKYKRLVENLTGKRIQSVKSDQGGEFMNNNFKYYLSKFGIIQLFTCTNKHEQNAVIERLNRSLFVKARTLLYHSNHNKKLWAEAVQCANYVRNRTYSFPIDNIPSRLWNNEEPDYSIFHVWGCLGYVRINENRRKKLDKQSIFSG